MGIRNGSASNAKGPITVGRRRAAARCGQHRQPEKRGHKRQERMAVDEMQL